MKDETRSLSYRAAFDNACAEIDQIHERMAQLRSRKETIEKAVDALKLVLDLGQTVEPSYQQPSSISVSVEPIPMPIQRSAAPSRLSSDRIQEHIDSVLRTLATA
jgi:hypothetical protein